MDQSIWASQVEQFANVDDDVGAYVNEEPTRVAWLAPLVRLRSFEETNVIDKNAPHTLSYKHREEEEQLYEQQNHVRWIQKERDFYIHKRRRFDFAPVIINKQIRNVWAAPTSLRATSNTNNNDIIDVQDNSEEMILNKGNVAITETVDVIVPLLTRATNSFDISQRQWETFCWLQENGRSGNSEEVLRRLALDYKLNVPPSLAVLNRTILLLGNDNKVEELMRLMEDFLIENLGNNSSINNHSSNQYCHEDKNNDDENNNKPFTSLSRHTLRLFIFAIGKTHILRAARLALMFCFILEEQEQQYWQQHEELETAKTTSIGNIHSENLLPIEVWEYLVKELAKLAESALSTATSSAHLRESHSIINKEFVNVFEQIIDALRQLGSELNEQILITFGRCMLLAKQPLDAVIALVQEELLTGRNRSNAENDNHDEVVVREERRIKEQLGAFLSELLIAVCVHALDETWNQVKNKTTAFVEQESVNARMKSVKENNVAMNAHNALLVFISDVVKYTYARQIYLSSHAFECMLAICDYWHSRERVLTFFVAMCVLSLPTSHAFLRFIYVCKELTEQWINSKGSKRVVCSVNNEEEEQEEEQQEDKQLNNGCNNVHHSTPITSFAVNNILQCKHQIEFYSWVLQRFDLFNSNKHERSLSNYIDKNKSCSSEKNMHLIDHNNKINTSDDLEMEEIIKAVEHEVQIDICKELANVIVLCNAFDFVRPILVSITIRTHAHCACTFICELLEAVRLSKMEWNSNNNNNENDNISKNNCNKDNSNIVMNKNTINLLQVVEQIRPLDTLCLLLTLEDMCDYCYCISNDSNDDNSINKSNKHNDKEIKAELVHAKESMLHSLHCASNSERVTSNNEKYNIFIMKCNELAYQLFNSLHLPSSLQSTHKMHCSILTSSALNKLAESDSAERAYVRMMEMYSKKDGALTIVLLDSILANDNAKVNNNNSFKQSNNILAPVEQLSRKAQVMLLTWSYAQHKWLCIIPFSATLLLELNCPHGNDESIDNREQAPLLYFHVFHVIKANGHERVMLITDDANEMNEAVKNNVKPVVLLKSLLERLSKQQQQQEEEQQEQQK